MLQGQERGERGRACHHRTSRRQTGNMSTMITSTRSCHPHTGMPTAVSRTISSSLRPSHQRSRMPAWLTPSHHHPCANRPPTRQAIPQSQTTPYAVSWSTILISPARAYPPLPTTFVDYDRNTATPSRVLALPGLGRRWRNVSLTFSPDVWELCGSDWKSALKTDLSDLNVKNLMRKIEVHAANRLSRKPKYHGFEFDNSEREG